ncbi:hypothetical protein [Achromobacter sp. MFA1 R4]|uniref:hypothetical protein n=1 Tax=Achromobacter sp. MFA1 R4 TaxID=1881016 RepID=UPI0009537DD4|nr:hypothetical protein [Achromobacter sp. MFA1 R4]SIS99800.1 hypothetical protein SAMN05428937_0002 [Achromobacter sp. MFA1 R4]
MDIKTLEALGVTSRIWPIGSWIRPSTHWLSSTGFNPDTEEETRYASRFKREIEARVQKAVDEKIAALAAVHIVPRVGEMIEQANMRKTNGYGEPKGPSLTFKEYIAHRAEVYMTEEVDYHGNSKADLEAKSESTYNWRNCGPRLTVLMRNYIADSLKSMPRLL